MVYARARGVRYYLHITILPSLSLILPPSIDQKACPESTLRTRPKVVHSAPRPDPDP